MEAGSEGAGERELGCLLLCPCPVWAPVPVAISASLRLCTQLLTPSPPFPSSLGAAGLPHPLLLPDSAAFVSAPLLRAPSSNTSAEGHLL